MNTVTIIANMTSDMAKRGKDLISKPVKGKDGQVIGSVVDVRENDGLIFMNVDGGYIFDNAPVKLSFSTYDAFIAAGYSEEKSAEMRSFCERYHIEPEALISIIERAEAAIKSPPTFDPVTTEYLNRIAVGGDTYPSDAVCVYKEE